MSIKTLKTVVFASVVSLLLAGHATAQDDPPFIGGDYMEFTSVELVPGQGLAYARHLADRWRSSMEFAKSKGWIKDFYVLSNIHDRDGEPDMWLVSVMESWEVDNMEAEKRRDAWREWSEATMEEMQQQYGDRSKMRRIMSTIFTRRMEFRD